MTAIGVWRRCTPAAPCPVCGRTKWCGTSADGSAAICMVTESQKPTANGGWLHILRNEPQTPRPRRRRLPVHGQPQDLAPLAEHLQRNLADDRIIAFASRLGVTAKSLRQLGCGWNGRAFGFPMLDAKRRVVGIRYRDPRTGSQWAEKGGKEGLFVPMDSATSGPILFPEGPTDTAALLSICDLAVIGRPSCSGGVKHCVEFGGHRDVAVCADADDPGRRGAEALATALLIVAKSVRVIEPPPNHKDFRDAVRAGLSASDIRRIIDAQEPRRLRVRIQS